MIYRAIKQPGEVVRPMTEGGKEHEREGGWKRKGVT